MASGGSTLMVQVLLLLTKSKCNKIEKKTNHLDQYALLYWLHIAHLIVLIQPSGTKLLVLLDQY